MEFLNDLLKNINAIYPLLWVGLPLALLIESSRRLLNFHDQHRQNKVAVADKYDDQNFNQVIKPLYTRVNQILLEKMILSGNKPTRTSEAAVRDYEAKKEQLLSTQDISQFEESVEFAQMQDEIINAKHSKYNHGKLYKRTRRSLWVVLILALVHSLVAVAYFIIQTTKNEFWMTTSVIVWASLAILSIIMLFKYFYEDIKLRNYGED